MAKTLEIPITQLDSDFYVRTALNQDHVIMLGELMESGVELNPITVTPGDGDNRYSVIDGRHRMAAADLIGLKTIRATVQGFDDKKDSIAAAFKANMGGSLPPTRADIDHTIALLLAAGAKRTEIAGLIPLPSSMVKKYIENIQSREGKRRVQSAIDELVLSRGMTIDQAAAKHGVDADTVRAKLAGVRKKDRVGTQEVKATLTGGFRSFNSRNAALLRKTVAMYTEGEVSQKYADDVFAHAEHLINSTIKSFQDWKARYQVTKKQS